MLNAVSVVNCTPAGNLPCNWGSRGIDNSPCQKVKRFTAVLYETHCYSAEHSLLFCPLFGCPGCLTRNPARPSTLRRSATWSRRIPFEFSTLLQATTLAVVALARGFFARGWITWQASRVFARPLLACSYSISCVVWTRHV